jgi:DNA-directed RNA polymerase beta subunit/DNA-directed RNA polymerase beta' subunit
LARLAPEEGFDLLKDRVQKAVSGLFPIIGRKNTLELHDVAVKDNLSIDDLRSQKQAKLSGRTWSVPVEATIVLKDNATGNVIDRQKMNLMNLPKVTSRYSHIVDGQEYQIDNQWRLKPGVYNMVKADGQLESHINAVGGFKIHFDPKSKEFSLNYGNSNMPLKPFLHAMGVSEEEIEKAWGKDIVDVNHADATKELAKFYRASTGDKTTRPTPDEAKAHLWEVMGKTVLRPEVNKFTLGKEYSTVTGPLLLDASHKLLQISRGETQPDPRDALMFKDLHSIEDFAAERIVKGSREILKKVSNNIDRKAKVRDIIAPEIFNRPIKQMFGKNSLAIVTDQTNPLEMMSSQMKTTIMGEGGVKSEHQISDDAKLIDPSHLGFLDPIHTPEGHATGITLRLPLGVEKFGHDVAVNMYNTKTKKMEHVNPALAYKSHVALPDQVYWDGKVPKAAGKIVKISGPGNEIYEGTLKDADYVMTDPLQMFSVSSNMIPFMQADHPNRSTMAGRQMEQAISLKHREVPLVQSLAGKQTFDKLVGIFASHRTLEDGVVHKIKPDSIVIKNDKGEKHEIYTYDHFPLNEDKAFLHAEPIVKVGDRVVKGQTVADTNYTKGGTLAIGTNLRAGFMPYKGYNFDDGIVVSESAAKKLTSEHLHRHSLERDIAHILDKKKFQAYMPTAMNKAQYDKLDEEGVVLPGTVIMPGDTLIAALRASNDPERKEDIELSKLHKSIVRPYKDSSIKWDSDYPGIVKEVVKVGKNVSVHVKTEEPLEIGDKLCYAEDHELLTSTGWKGVKDVVITDLICSLNPETDEIEYLPPAKVVSYDCIDDDLYVLDTTQVSMAVTMEHKTYAKLRSSARHELLPVSSIKGKRYRLKMHGKWTGTDASVFTFPALQVKAGQGGRGTRWLPAIDMPMDTFLMLLGMFLSEGNVYSGNGDHYIEICQIKQPSRSHAEEALHSAGIGFTNTPEKLRIHGKQLYEYFVQFGHAPNKYVPDWVFQLPPKRLRVLYKWLMWGDGYEKGSVDRYTSVSSQLADDIQRLLLHLGLAGRVITEPGYRGSIKGVEYDFKTRYRVQVIKSKLEPTINHGHAKKQNGQEEQITKYTGKVYCVALPRNHVLYTRRKGKVHWSGNTGRHGNKGIVTYIVQDHDMPHTKDGRPIEILLNPLGVTGRTNLGQVLEVAAGKIAEKTGKVYTVKNFAPGTDLHAQVTADLEKSGLTDKEEVIDPSTGKTMGDVLVGPMHVLKLHHQVEKKLSSRAGGTGYAYDKNMIPKGGGPQGAKSLGTLGLYSMLAHGAVANLREMQTLKCFTWGTRIFTDQGQIQIGKIVNQKLDVRVLSWNPVTGSTEYRPILNYWKRPAGDDKLVEIEYHAHGERGVFTKHYQRCTPDHKVYIEGGIKTAAKDVAGKNVLVPALKPNQYQLDVLVGSLLGDGSMGVQNGPFPAFVERHCLAQQEYLAFKADVLSDFSDRIVTPYNAGEDGFNTGQTMCEWATLAQPEFVPLYKSFYCDGIKRVPTDIVDLLTPLSLAIWYQDDGSLTHGNRQRILRLHVGLFNTTDCDLLVDAILKLTGVQFTVGTTETTYNGRPSIQRFLRVGTRAGIDKFLDIVRPYVHSCLSYKVDDQACGEKLAEVSDRSVAQFVLTPVEVHSVRQTNFQQWDGPYLYDLEVEENHNYFANYMLVGNSDASQGDQFWSAIQAGEMLPTPKPTFAYNKFLGYIRGLGVNVQKTGNNLTLLPMTDKQIIEQSNGETVNPALWVTAKNMKPESGGLFDPKVTGGLEGTKWSHYNLPEAFPNPVFESAIIRLLGIKQKEFSGLVGGTLAVDPVTGKIGPSEKVKGGLVGGLAFEHMLGKIDVKKDLAAAKQALEKPTLKGSYLDHANSKVKLLQALDKVGMTPKEAYLAKTIPILPPSMRPLPVLPNGTISEEDLNGLYKNLHLSASRYAKMSPLIPDDDPSKVDVRNEIYDGLSALAGIGGYPKQVRRGILDYIHGKKVIDFNTGAKGGSPKEGFFQDQLVERKQDMSMRGTIIPEPSLGLDEVGLPRSAAIEVYKPFVVRELKNILGVTPLQAQKLLDQGGETVDRALDRVISNRPILLKRDPVLHKYGVQAFKPRIVGGKAVQVHPLVTSGFNADFDGDAMGAFVPVSVDAVAEAHKMLPSRNLFSPSTGEIMYAPTNESRLGLYGIMQPGKITAHKFTNMQDMEAAARKGDVKLTDQVDIGGIKATVGRFMVAGALPESMRRALLEGKEPLDKKAQEALFTKIGKEHKGDYGEVANKLKDLGNMWATNTAFSIGMKDIAPERQMRDRILAEADAQVHKLTGPHKDQKQIDIYAKATDEMNKHLRSVSETDNNLMLLHNVGMKGGTDTLRQIRAAPMLMSNHKGEIIPIPVRRSYSEGLDVADYWTAISGSRKGIIQKVQSVQEPGYISKQVMNSVMNNLIVDHDCGTDKGIALPVDEKDILDRYTAADIKAGSHVFKSGTLITPEVRNTLRNNNVGKVVVRSPLRCLHGPGICQKSMLPETVVTAKHDGVIHNLSLEALFDLVSAPIDVSDCGVEMKMPVGWEISDSGEWVGLERVVRHARELNKAMLEVRTTHGRTQHLTEDHTAIVWRPTSCVCGSLRISIDNRSPDTKAYLYCRDCKRNWTVDREAWEFAERLEIPAEQVMPGDRIEYYPFLTQFHGEKPATPSLDPYWLGLYLAEGSTDRNRDYPRTVNIAQQDNKWRPGMIKACTAVTKNEPHATESSIVINDAALVRELVMVLGSLELCDRKVLPTTWLFWDDRYIGDVVSGLIDGDGHARERDNGTHEVLIGSTSYTLLVQVQDWLARHGVRADLSCKTHTPKPGDIVKTRRDFFHLTFSANDLVLSRLKRSQKMLGLSACNGKYDLNKKYATVLQVKDVSDRIHCKYVYDVTTTSRKFTANGLHTHNCFGLTENGVLPEKGLNVGVLAGQALGERTTQLALKAFHCSHAKSIVFVRGTHTGVLPITLEALFDLIESPIYMSGTEEVKSVSGWQVWDSEWVNLTHVRRHPPSRPMKLVGDGGLVTICQDNHPIGVWENKVRCTRCDYRKFKDPHKKSRQYCRRCGSPQEVPLEKMGELTFLPPSDLLRNDVYLHRDISPIMYVRAATTPNVDAYIAGMFLAEGSTAWKKSSKRAVEKPYQVQISQKSGPIQDKIMLKLRKAGWRPRRHKRYIEMDSLKLGVFFSNTFGRYSSNKHLPFDFLGYPTDWLVEMLIGLIDGDGTVLPQSDGPDAINIDSTSFALVQQVVLLCTRLGLTSSIVSTTIKKLTRHQGFAVRIRMTKEAKELLRASEKVRKTIGVSPTRSPELTGHRLVSVIKDTMYTDEYVYDATTETGTLYVSGIKHHNTGGTASSKSALVDDFENVKNLLAFPKVLPGSATLSEVNGKVTKVAPSAAGGYEVTVEGHTHYIPHAVGAPSYNGQPLTVGMEVKKGSPISDGLVNPHEMLSLTGIEPVQLHLAKELHHAFADAGIRRRNHEVVVKALTNLTKIKDPGDSSGYIRGDFASTSHVSSINRNMAKGLHPIVHEPILKGVNVLPLEMQEDWIAKLNHENLSETIISAAQKGWTSNIHSVHPIPAIVYGAEIGKGPEGKVGY